jgi:hypothetical protein
MLYAYRTLAAALIALPAASLLGGPTSGYPRGQGELFDPGGLMLVESLRLGRRAFPAIQWSAGALALVVVLGGVFPLGALLAGLARSERLTIPVLLEKSWTHAGTLALILLLGVLAQAGAAALLVVLGGKAIGAASLSPPADDLSFIALFAVTACVALVIGVVRDVACVAAVRSEHGFYLAASKALACVRRAFGRLLLAWAFCSALGAAALVAGALLAPPLAGASAAGIALGVIVHQAAVAGATFAHVAWLAAAMRIHDEVGSRAEPAPVVATEPEPAEAQAPPPE